ncbi:MAG: Rne/Rng family ribonuclease [Actinomycetota bacterium]
MTEETERAAEQLEGAGEATTPRPRRRPRGGRGRGRSRSSSAIANEITNEIGGSTVVVSAPESLGGLGRAQEGLEDAAEPSEGEAAPAPTRRRRRRGGRGRGSKRPSVGEGGDALPAPEETAVGPEPDGVKESVAAPGESRESGAEISVGTTTPKKRRRRGGRGRGGRRRSVAAPAGTGEPGQAEAVPEAESGPVLEAVPEPIPEAEEGAGRVTLQEGAPASEAEAPEKAPAKRGRRARKESGSAEETAGPTRVRGTRQSTGRRRREPMPIAPRVTDKLMVITEHGERDQIAILEGRDLVQHYVTRAGARSMVGNVYLGRVQNVLPGMEAAFVDVGRGRNAVLYAGEVNFSPEDLDRGAAPRIEHVLKNGQSVLVQVTKDPIGGKGARLTSQISMPGRYVVLVPDSNITGTSRRLPDNERRRLKTLLKKIRPEDHGLIIRTAAEGAREEALTADVARVIDEWQSIAKRAKRAKAPSLLYEEPELTVRAVRDLFNDEEFRELVTDSPRVYELVVQYLGQVAPYLLPKVRLHQGKLPVFEEFHVVEQIHKGLDRKVWLPSGGYLVIDRTEALTVIDVNTGKSVGKTNLEETVVNTNIEAAREVARQLRLRDIGGMIVVDFIDMLLEQNKKKVVDALKEEMARDKTRSQVFDIGPLGLLEVTRKRVSGGLLESFSETCPTCEGRGVLLNYEA